MNLKNKKVLVTGADGFIGSHLVESLLDHGAEVKAFTLGVRNKMVSQLSNVSSLAMTSGAAPCI